MEPHNVGVDIDKEGELLILDEESRSSSISSTSAASASSDFSFEDPYSTDRNEHASFSLGHDHSEHGLLQQEMVASDSDRASPTASTLESPPMQTMERPADASDYRIPSYVFARNKSNAPNQEWSTASNESLFSIHTGNMSFTRDQFSWLLKSGELGMYAPGPPGDIRKSGELGKVSDLQKSGELPPPSPRTVHKSGEQKPVDQKPVDIRKSGELPPMPPTVPDMHKSGEQIIAAHFNKDSNKDSSSSPAMQKVASSPRVSVASSPRVSVASSPRVSVASSPRVSAVSSSRASEASAVDLATGARREDVKEGKHKKGPKASIEEIPQSNSVSPHSDASGQSFAFPVLAEIDRQKSVNSGASRAETSKGSVAHDQEGQSKSHTANPDGATPAASSWFSRFSCCSCC